MTYGHTGRGGSWPSSRHSQEKTVTGMCHGEVWKAQSEGKYYNEAGGWVEGRPAGCPLLWLGVFGSGEYQNTRWERLGRTDLGWVGREELCEGALEVTAQGVSKIHKGWQCRVGGTMLCKSNVLKLTWVPLFIARWRSCFFLRPASDHSVKVLFFCA